MKCRFDSLMLCNPENLNIIYYRSLQVALNNTLLSAFKLTMVDICISQIGTSLSPFKGLAWELCQPSCCLYGPRFPVLPTCPRRHKNLQLRLYLVCILHRLGSLFGPGFTENFLNCMHLPPSWLTHLLPSKVWICPPCSHASTVF